MAQLWGWDLLNDNQIFNRTSLVYVNVVYNMIWGSLSDDEKQAKVRHQYQPPCTIEAWNNAHSKTNLNCFFHLASVFMKTSCNLDHEHNIVCSKY